MGNSLKTKFGSVFNRNDLINLRIKDFIQELHIHLLELHIIRQTIQIIQNKKLYLFDSLIGDRKCQTRTSIILDIINDNNFIKSLKSTQITINLVIDKTNELINQITNYQHQNLEKLNNFLQKKSVYTYLCNQKININICEKLKISCLAYVTCISKAEVSQLALKKLSSNKLDRLIVSAKIKLCDLSIKYEQNLAKKYGCLNEQKISEHIESKGFCSMISTFPSFKHILQKIKDYNQALLHKIIHFCICGGVKNKIEKYFIVKNNIFNETIITEKDNYNAVMVINSYQYQGSFIDLKKKLNVPENATLIENHFHKKCICSNNYNPKIDDIELAMIASLTQHPQYTTHDEIDFKKLDLINSKIHQEYLALKKLNGYCRKNMSNLFIYHIYPSTIKDALQSEISLEKTNTFSQIESIQTPLPHEQQPEQNI